MRIAMIASECEPLAKTGGLADVVDSLSRALGGLGHQVDVYLPRYPGVEAPGPTEELRLAVPTGTGQPADVRLLTAAADGYRIRLVDHPPSYDRPDYYVADGTDYPDNGARFALLGRTALETIRHEGGHVDIVHGHDWEGSPALLLLRERYAADLSLAPAARVLTCHNLAYHGYVRRAEVARQLDVPAEAGGPAGLDLLRAGIRNADMVNTVSPTFAAESRQKGRGAGLEDALNALGERYVGILNGLDEKLWDPATDATLPARYSASDPSGKEACRAALCSNLRLDPDGPILAMVSRLDPQKGFDLLGAAADGLLELGARLVVLGTGDRAQVAALEALARARPDRLVVAVRFDRDLARLIYAGADALLMPSHFEPCGLSQLIALRYGTIPIVRATGGLVDTVVDADAAPASGTGFAFGPADPSALLDASRRALTAMADSARWRQIQARAMAADFSWPRSAREYVALYERAIAWRAAQSRDG
jgi:starch synthase